MFRGIRDVSEPDEGLEVSSLVFWSRNKLTIHRFSP